MKEYTVVEFMQKMQDEITLHEHSFILNMKNGGAEYDKMDFMGWLDYFLNWMEWGDEESYRNAYD